MPAAAVQEELIEVAVRTTNRSSFAASPRPRRGSSTAASSSAAYRVRNSTPTARTNGSANGSSMRGWAALAALALPAATSVAVAPTPVARSPAIVVGTRHGLSFGPVWPPTPAADPKYRLQLRD